jgi:hypothetical protein
VSLSQNFSISSRARMPSGNLKFGSSDSLDSVQSYKVDGGCPYPVATLNEACQYEDDVSDWQQLVETYRCATMLQIAQVRTLSLNSSSISSTLNLLKSCVYDGRCRPSCMETCIIIPHSMKVGSVEVLLAGKGHVQSKQRAFTTW